VETLEGVGVKEEADVEDCSLRVLGGVVGMEKGEGGGTSWKQSPIRRSLHQFGLPLVSFGLLSMPNVTSSWMNSPSMVGLQ
jgi:hypothetical protein